MYNAGAGQDIMRGCGLLSRVALLAILAVGFLLASPTAPVQRAASASGTFQIVQLPVQSDTCFHQPFITADGEVLLHGTGPNGPGMLLVSPYVVTTVIEDGASAAPFGDVFEGFCQWNTFSINVHGDLAFDGFASCSVSCPATGIFRLDPGLGRCVRQRDLAPAGGLFENFQKAIINDSGEILFRGSVELAPGFGDGGLFKCTQAGVAEVVRGIDLQGINSYAFNNAGDVAYASGVTPSAFIPAGGGGSALIDMPGARSIAMNDAGQVAVN